MPAMETGLVRLIAQISDMHLAAQGQLAYGVVDSAQSLRNCVASLAALSRKPDLLLLTGDLVNDPSEDNYRFLRVLLAPLGVSMYPIAGNHDEREALLRVFADCLPARVDPPFIQYVIEQEPRIVMLDTVVEGQDYGYLCARRLKWLDDVLSEQPHSPTIIAMHHPPISTQIGFMDDIALKNPGEFATLLRAHPQVCAIVCGHVHRSIFGRFPNESGGIPVSVCPSPSHQISLQLTGTKLESFMKEPAGFHLHLWHRLDGLVTHHVPIGQFAGPYPFAR